jgi:hypothetical protein
MENNPKRSIYYIFYHVIFCSALRKVLLGLGLFSKKKKKIVAQSRTGLQIYEGHDDQLNRPAPMA